MSSSKHFHASLLLIIAGFIFVFWEELIAAGLHIYSWTGSPYAERALGEFYSHKASLESRRAAIHFQKALYGYKLELPLANADHQKWIEFIIGTHYECGRGVPPDLKEAQKWYQRSVEHGFVEGQEMLERVSEALKAMDKKNPE